jgi:hypothetical protein
MHKSETPKAVEQERDKINPVPVEEDVPPLDVAAVMAQIHAAVQRRRALPPRPRATPPAGSFAPRLSRRYLVCRGLQQFGAHMFEAEEHAHAGLNPPHFGGPLGRLFRLTARVICKVMNFITGEQRRFNAAILSCLWDLHEAVRQLERTQDSPRRPADAPPAGAGHKQAS